MSKIIYFCGFLLIFILQGCRVAATCYFQQDFQGEYVMQGSVADSGVQYSMLHINDTSISIWGNCHKRIGNNFILVMSYGEMSCIRCLHLKLRSSNVLQVIADEKTFSTCEKSEESAERSCPIEEMPISKNMSEMLLFKTKDNQGIYTDKKYCPIDDKYVVSYTKKLPGSHKVISCRNPNSTLDTCPSGATLKFELTGCNTKGNIDIKFDCMGDWTGQNDNKYLILNDNRALKGESVKYRCAIYKEDGYGQVHMALSNDSTCITDLHNASNGFETFLLTPKHSTSWPIDVSTGTLFLFPDWMQGTWEHVRVKDDTLIYHDHSSFKTYTIKCAGILEGGNKFLIYYKTQCGEEHYSCMQIHKRSDNILEFQLGTKKSNTNEVYNLCEDENFSNNSWVTQGRLSDISPGMCPISGEFTGIIPDSTELCAKLWSDCRAPELMYYQVSHCKTKEIYEEREYKCLGHWKEDNLLYTYTERKDVAEGTYECFVGSIKSPDEIFIKEAGGHCQRHINPLKDGMKLEKRGLYSCISKEPNTPFPKPKPTSTTMATIAMTKSTRKPWNFDNDANPSKPKNTTGSASTITILAILYLFPMFIQQF